MTLPRILDQAALSSFPEAGLQLIESSAGTGKTYTLANLYLHQILSGRQVREILVVTFTEAATDELQARIRTRLSEALSVLRGEREPDDSLRALLPQDEKAREAAQDRLVYAVRAMDEAKIFTIHGFCKRILSEQAFYSAQPFQTEIENRDEEHQHRFLQDWWRRQIYPRTPSEARFVQTALGDLPQFQSLLVHLWGIQPKQLLPEVSDSLDALWKRYARLQQRLTQLADHWQREGKRLRDLLETSPGLRRKGAYQKDRLSKALDQLSHWFQAPDLPLPNAFERLTIQKLEEQSKAPDPALSDPFFQECGQLYQDLETLQRDLKVAALRDAAAFVQGEMKAYKAREQRLSYDDLLRNLRDALAGAQGKQLGDRVRQQFPVAMIDEFQDTDAIQYEIFRRLYRGQAGCQLVMIGDPKQAIYSFRGGDIFTYITAKRDVGPAGLYTLDTNWRSTPEVIQAINTLFQNRPDPFVFQEDIPFLPAKPAVRSHRPLIRRGKPQPALTLWSLLEEGERPKNQAVPRIHTAIAQEIARLIEAGRRKEAFIGDRPLQPKDIAVLVRFHREGDDLRRSLGELGIAAVSRSTAQIFSTSEAKALDALLQAVVTPKDPDSARLALASPLLQKTLAEIESLLQEETAWHRWVDHLLHLQDLWRQRGFMPMFQHMIRVLGIAEALAREPAAERRLTNLLHLGEVLHQASKEQGGLDALLSWYRHRCREAAQRGAARRGGAARRDEMELRLESDEDLVQILTIHSSKGLEYPVVFLPDLWDCKETNTKTLLRFHRDQQAYLDAGSPDFQQHRWLAERERLAEDLRLLYVALTRAESALYLVWGNIHKATKSALAYLLHPHQSGESLKTEGPGAFQNASDLPGDLIQLAQRAGGTIQVLPLPEAAPVRLPPESAALSDLCVRTFRRTIDRDWRVSSFSAMARGVHQGPVAPRSAEKSPSDVGLRFPAGPQVGSYLHLLLERLDFQQPIEPQVLRESERIALRFGLDHERYGQDAADLLARVVATPLNDSGLSLARIDGQHRLSELAFDFSTQRLHPEALNDLLQAAAGRSLPPLALESFRGLVNGVIDLVFAWRDRFYIADYKSNFLGDRFEDYGPEKLQETVFIRRYDLQYLLYSLALHRYLRQRWKDYVYERHFGGIYYLFLRAMRPETGPRFGVYFYRPDFSRIQALDQQIFPPS